MSGGRAGGGETERQRPWTLAAKVAVVYAGLVRRTPAALAVLLLSLGLSQARAAEVTPWHAAVVPGLSKQARRTSERLVDRCGLNQYLSVEQGFTGGIGNGDGHEDDRDRAGNTLRFDLATVGAAQHGRYAIKLRPGFRICGLWGNTAEGDALLPPPSSVRRTSKRTFELVDPAPVGSGPDELISFQVWTLDCRRSSERASQRECRSSRHPGVLP